MPPERDLAIKLNCSRSSLREAFRVLESQGLIVSKTGGGRYVQKLDKKNFTTETFSTIDLLEKSAITYFLEAREAFEPRIVELACERATKEDIVEIENALKVMEEKLKKPELEVSADNNFHVVIAEATHNYVFVSMMENNVNMIRQVRRKVMKNPARYKESLKEHTEILEAIKKRDKALAVEKTKRHLEKLKNSIIIMQENS